MIDYKSFDYGDHANYMFEHLIYDQPSLAERAVSWEVLSEHEIVVEDVRGNKYAYCYLTGMAEPYRDPRRFDMRKLDDKAWKKEFTYRLRQKFNRRGLTQADVADYMGIPLITLGSWLRGDRMPSARNIIRLAEALDCDVRELLMVEMD